MVKLTIVVRRRAELSPEEFRDYWLNTHGPLVRSLAKALRARKYVQSHPIDSPAIREAAKMRRMAEPFDGITEIWFDSSEDLTSALGTPEGRDANRAIAEDQAKYCDLQSSSVFLAEEHTIFDHS